MEDTKKTAVVMEPGMSFKQLMKKEKNLGKAAGPAKPPHPKWAPPIKPPKQTHAAPPQMNENIQNHGIPEKVKARFALKKDSVGSIEELDILEQIKRKEEDKAKETAGKEKEVAVFQDAQTKHAVYKTELSPGMSYRELAKWENAEDLKKPAKVK